MIQIDDGLRQRSINRARRYIDTAFDLRPYQHHAVIKRLHCKGIRFVNLVQLSIHLLQPELTLCLIAQCESGQLIDIRARVMAAIQTAIKVRNYSTIKLVVDQYCEHALSVVNDLCQNKHFRHDHKHDVQRIIKFYRYTGIWDPTFNQRKHLDFLKIFTNILSLKHLTVDKRTRKKGAIDYEGAKISYMIHYYAMILQNIVAVSFGEDSINGIAEQDFLKQKSQLNLTHVKQNLILSHGDLNKVDSKKNLKYFQSRLEMIAQSFQIASQFYQLPDSNSEEKFCKMLFDRYSAGHLVIIPDRLLKNRDDNAHCSTVLFYAGYIIKCNRGQYALESGALIYKMMQDTVIDADFFQRYLQFKTTAESLSCFYKTKPKLITGIVAGASIYGNCTSANTKYAILAADLMLQLPDYSESVDIRTHVDNCFKESFPIYKVIGQMIRDVATREMAFRYRYGVSDLKSNQDKKGSMLNYEEAIKQYGKQKNSVKHAARAKKLFVDSAIEKNYPFMATERRCPDVKKSRGSNYFHLYVKNKDREARVIRYDKICALESIVTVRTIPSDLTELIDQWHGILSLIAQFIPVTSTLQQSIVKITEFLSSPSSVINKLLYLRQWLTECDQYFYNKVKEIVIDYLDIDAEKPLVDAFLYNSTLEKTTVTTFLTDIYLAIMSDNALQSRKIHKHKSL